MTRACMAAMALCLGLASPAFAQEIDNGRLEVSGGVRWNGHVRFPDVAANETTPGNGTRPLFVTSTMLDASAGAGITFGVRVSRAVRADVTVGYNPTHLSTRVKADREGIADITVKENVTQFLFEAGVVVQPRRWQRSWLSPLVSAGGGWLRQLNDGRTLVQNGQSAYVGAGVYYVERASRPGRIKASGIRADIRVQAVRGGVALDDRVHAAPTLTASVFTWF